MTQAPAAFLVFTGTNVSTADEFGRTPLHIAVTNGKSVMVQMLVDAGAAVNAKNTHGNTPLYTILHAQIARTQAQYTDLLTDITDDVSVLIAAGAAVNAENDSRNTPIDLANGACRWWCNAGKCEDPDVRRIGCLNEVCGGRCR